MWAEACIKHFGSMKYGRQGQTHMQNTHFYKKLFKGIVRKIMLSSKNGEGGKGIWKLANFFNY